MRITCLVCLLSIALTTLNAQQKTPVSIGSVDTVRSAILGTPRAIWIHLPPSYLKNSANKKKYPVIYLLDAERYFTSLTGIVDVLSSMNGNTYWPEMIVVGIPNTHRIKDLTPTRVTEGLWIDGNMQANSGGGENFLAFIEKELIPHIGSSYPATPYRMLIGHSLGGLMVIQSFVHHKDMFASYAAIDPSLWWDKQRLLHEAEEALKTTSYDGKALVLSMAHTQPAGMDTVSMQRDTTSGTLHPRSIMLLSKSMKRTGQNSPETDFKYYPDEGHGSIPVIAMYDALHFIFKDYTLKIQENYFTDAAFNMARLLGEHYEKMGMKYGLVSDDGRTLLPPQGMVDGIAFRALRDKQFTKAEDLFKMNVKNYPDNSRVYSSLGDYYAAKGDKVSAISSYRKSLALKVTPETSNKLEKMLKQD